MNVSYNNETDFSSQILCYESLVDIEVSNKLKHLIIDRSYSLGSSDVITNVNTMTPINPLFYYENKRREHGC